MSGRTTHSIAHFAAPFVLGGLEGKLPAGDYDIDHDEELIDGMSWLAWRRVATFIHLTAIAAAGATQKLVPIEPTFLDAALEQDQRQS